MKLLHTSDWHIGRSLFEFSLLEDQQEIFRQIASIIEREQVDAVLISGDLYDRSMPSAQAVSLLDEMFTTLISRYHLPILAISGNHDSARRVAYGSRLFEQSGLYLAGGFSMQIKKVTLQDAFGPVNFFLLPYFIPQQVRLALEDSSIRTASEAFEKLIDQNREQIDPNERNVLLAHGFFMRQNRSSSAKKEQPELPQCSGSETSVGTSDLTDLACCDGLFDYVALGHLHGAQSAGSERMRYSGSPLKYSVDEANSQKSVTIVELGEKGELSTRQIPLTPRRDLRVITGTIEQLCDPQLASDDYVFAQLISQGPVLNAMSRLREVYPHTLGLSFHQTLPSPSAILSQNPASLPPEELFDRFYQQVQQQELSEAQQKIVQSTLRQVSQELL